MSLATAGLIGVLSLTTGPKDGATVRARAAVAMMSHELNTLHAARIPAWARKYNMSCSGCHYPAPPRLNATGIRFRWAGYRMPEEIGENAEVASVSNYLATRFKGRYTWVKPVGEPTDESEFSLPDASVLYGGSFGRNFGGFFEAAKEEDEVEFGASFTAVWGKEKSHGGIKVGQTHLLLNSGLAGFDRPTGVNAPSPLADPLTSAIPFSLSGDQAGAEAFYVTGSNRVVAQLFTASRPGDRGLARGGTTGKDLVLTDQLLLDKNGGGIQGTLYYGTVTGLDASEALLNSHFWRVAVTASRIVGGFEVLGGLVAGRDFDLPAVTRTELGADANKGLGYWVSGQYILSKQMLTLYGRYEVIDPNRDLAGDSRRRYLLGAVLPVNLPEYLRLGAEYWYDRVNGPSIVKRHNLAAEVMVSF